MSGRQAAELRGTPASTSDSGRFWNGRRIDHVRMRLEERRSTLEDALRSHRAREAVAPGRSGSAPDGAAAPAEAAAGDWLTDVGAAAIDRDARELAEIDAALERLDAGNYGVCVDCAAPISPVRLIYAPQAARCLACEERLGPLGASNHLNQ